MHENKNTQSHNNKDRLLLGAGAAVVGASVLLSVASANEIGSIETSYASELPSHDQSASPTSVHLEPTISSVNSSEHSAINTPSFKGKISIKKPSNKPKVSGPEDSKPIGAILTPPSDTIPQHGDWVSLNPESMTVADNVKAIMDRDSVYITSSGCSGSLVRNKTGEAIGIVTAEHCGLRGSGKHSTPRILGSDGDKYIVSSAPIEAMTGPDQSHLKSAGIVKELFVPASNDINNDMAFGAFEGHTAQEVTIAYNHNKLSASDLSKLKLGDRMYISGWPVSQPEDGGNFERQNFPLSYLGEEMVTTSLGETMNMIWSAVPTSKDGADCSFGDSGGKAFVMEGVHSRSVGVLAAFVDFTGKLWGGAENGAYERKYFEQKYNVDLSSFDAVCGIATETPTVESGGEVIKSVSSYSEIPIQHNSITSEIPANVEKLINKASDEFFDPNYVKTWVRGAINLDPNGKGNWKMNPVIFYDKESGGAVLATYTDNAKDGVELDYLPDFKDQKFNGYPELINETGVIDVFSNQGGSGFINNSGGQIFGLSENNPNAIKIIQEAPSFSLYFDDSTQSLQIMQYKHN